MRRTAEQGQPAVPSSIRSTRSVDHRRSSSDGDLSPCGSPAEDPPRLTPCSGPDKAIALDHQMVADNQVERLTELRGLADLPSSLELLRLPTPAPYGLLRPMSGGWLHLTWGHEPDARPAGAWSDRGLGKASIARAMRSGQADTRHGHRCGRSRHAEEAWRLEHAFGVFDCRCRQGDRADSEFAHPAHGRQIHGRGHQVGRHREDLRFASGFCSASNHQSTSLVATMPRHPRRSPASHRPRGRPHPRYPPTQ